MQILPLPKYPLLHLHRFPKKFWQKAFGPHVTPLQLLVSAISKSNVINDEKQQQQHNDVV